MEEFKNESVMAKRVLGVLRASTIRQEVESQKKELKEFILSKGYKSSQIVWREYRGASARKENDKYKAMIEEVKTIILSRQIEAVALWHLNRLGRTETSLIKMKEFFEKNKIQVYVKNPNLQLFDVDSQGNLVKNNGTSIAWSIFATMVKFDTEEQFQKTQRGKEYIIQQGKCVSGKAKFGYYVDNEKYIRVDAKESEIVKLIYRKYASEDITISQLTDYLNSNGYCYRNDKEFNFKHLVVMLKDTTYIGKSKSKSNYPAIVSEYVYNKCMEKRETRNANADKAKRKFNLCSKLIKCEYCGHSYTSKGERYKDSGSDKYYQLQGKQCLQSPSILIKYADIAIRESFQSCYFNYSFDIKKIDKNLLEKEANNLRSRISNFEISLKKLEQKQARINTTYYNGNSSDAQYNEAISKVKEDIIEKKKYISELKVQLNYKNEQIQFAENTIENPDNAMAIYRSIEALSSQEVYNILHDSKVALINSAYLRKIKFQGKNYTAMVVVRNDGIKDIYLFQSYARGKSQTKLYKVNLYKDEVRISEYEEGGVEITSEYMEELPSGFLPSSVVAVNSVDLQTLKSLQFPLSSAL